MLLALALPASAAAATTTLDQQSIDRIARGDSRMTEVQRVHPLAVWKATYRPASRTWIARLSEPSRSVLATLTVRDRDSVVTAAKVNPGALETHLLTKNRADTIAGTSPKVRDWMARYTRAKAKITSSTSFENGAWVRHWWANGTEVARVLVNDKDGHDHRRLHRPAGRAGRWPAARRARSAGASTSRGSSGRCCCCSSPGCSTGAGSSLCATSTSSRSPRSRCRSGYFNEGLVFWSVPLQYPPLIYLFVRLVAIGCGRAPAGVVHHPLAGVAGGRAGGVRDGLPGGPQLLVLQRDRRRLRQRRGIRPAAVAARSPTTTCRR